MKIFSLIILSLLIINTLAAQKGEVKDAEKYLEKNDLDYAKRAIDKAVDGKDDEKTLNWPDTWYIRGKVYKALYESPAPMERDIEVAYEAFKKALDLGDKEMEGKNKDYKEKAEIISHLQKIAGYFLELGKQKNYDKNYDKALSYLQYSLEIQGMPEINKTDSATIFNAGIAAKCSGKFDLAKSYFQKSIDINYKGTDAYFQLADMLKISNKTAEYTASLKAGIEAYPGQCGRLSYELVEYYYDVNNTDAAMAYLEGVNKKYPGKPDILTALGNLHEKNQEKTKALQYYKDAYKLNSISYSTNYHLGFYYYNKAVEFIHEADRITPENKIAFNTKITESNARFEKARPFMEKAYKRDPEDVRAIQKLQTIYRKLGMYRESMEMKKLLD